MSDQPDPAVDDGPLWRVGRHHPIHVYEIDPVLVDGRPVATFHDSADAARAVTAVNRGKVPDDEFVLLPPRGWLNRVDEILREHMRPDGDWTKQELAAYRAMSAGLGDLIRGWAVGLDNDR